MKTWMGLFKNMKAPRTLKYPLGGKRTSFSKTCSTESAHSFVQPQRYRNRAFFSSVTLHVFRFLGLLEQSFYD